MNKAAKFFAVPGNITSQTSFGPNFLIKDGAKLVQQARDIIEEFPRAVRESLLGISHATDEKGKKKKSQQPTFESSCAQRAGTKVNEFTYSRFSRAH